MPSYEAKRCPGARRTVRLLRALANQSLKPSELAAILGMGQTQTYRYVWALQKEGIPIQLWRGEGNIYEYVLDKHELMRFFVGQNTEGPVRRPNGNPFTALLADEPIGR